MLTMILRQTNDTNRMNVLCYDVMRTIQLRDNIIFPMLNIAVLWPDVLRLNDAGIGKSKFLYNAPKSTNAKCFSWFANDSQGNSKCMCRVLPDF